MVGSMLGCVDGSSSGLNFLHPRESGDALLLSVRINMDPRLRGDDGEILV
jgi:hypothetical protein